MWSLFLGARETLLRGGNVSIFHEVPLIYKMAALLFYQLLFLQVAKLTK
jgi:hypothetical protein